MDKILEQFLHEFDLPLVNPVLVFSLILMIILLSPILLKRINIPGIIGLILSGVLIGPHGLHLLEKTSAIELFSTIGLLYIMFIAGLELDMNEFKATRNKGMVFGFLTFSIPILIGYPVCRYILNYDVYASFLTASMFATHTLVAYPIVSKLGVSKSPAVAISVGGTILTDSAVLIIFAVLMGSVQGGLTQEFWLKLIISLSIFSIIMFWLIPRIARWFFRKLESERHSHYIFVLAVVFFAAFLSELAGVEPIIGAFVAGLALNPLIPHSSALMNRIEFIGNSLFIPFFLISVGMVVDIHVLLKGPMALIVAGVLTTVAILSKWLAAFFTQKLFRFNSSQRQLIFGLSSAHAAATLAIILVGYKAGILDENILNGTIILILITCIVASLATEKAAKRIVLQMDQDIQGIEISEPDEHILLPVANFTGMEKILDFVSLLKDKKSPYPVSVLSVVPNNEEAEQNIYTAKHKLQSFISQASVSDMPIQVIATIDHNIAGGIARTSKEIMADCIVLGWPQRTGIIEKIIGDKVESIVSHTEKTIFICHFEQLAASHTRMVVLLPPLAECETGFHYWFSRLLKLCTELHLHMVLYCNNTSRQGIEKYMKQKSQKLEGSFVEFDTWEDFLVLSRDFRSGDILVFINARKNSVSHMNILESIPLKMEKHFEQNSRMVIYPSRGDSRQILDSYENINTVPLNKGIEAAQKIGRRIMKSLGDGER